MNLEFNKSRNYADHMNKYKLLKYTIWIEQVVSFLVIAAEFAGSIAF
jgi:hypothetical protein